MFLGLSFLFTMPLSLLSALILFWFLLALSLIDLATYLLPDRLTLPLLWAGLLVHSISGEVTLQDALYGAAAGYMALWLLYWGVKIVSGKEGMGYGDFKLLAALGAWVGWQMLPYLCILAALAGIVFALVRMGVYKMSEQIPFGPCLAMAGALIYISQESNIVWLMFR
jgi:prepilin signal peptidase PulO-like enzyme (type II secretory pathway)